jgi:hypothetical protein
MSRREPCVVRGASRFVDLEATHQARRTMHAFDDSGERPETATQPPMPHVLRGLARAVGAAEAGSSGQGWRG